MKNKKPLIKITNLELKLGGKQILNHIDLTIEKGEQIALIGLNGAGKSTLLKVILGDLQPTSGKINRYKTRIGYVPQKLQLDSTIPLTVMEFIKLYNKLPLNKIEAKIKEFSIEHLQHKQLSKLSGGELQKVLILNAAIKEPDLLLLDEPTAAIDLDGEKNFYAMIKKIRQEYNPALIIVSHNIHTVFANTDRVVCLNNHICCHGTPTSITSNKKFQEIFGQHLTPYSHQHDHSHTH